MLIGKYRHTMDKKGRVIVPQKFRGDLGDCFIITRGLDGCLFLYPQDLWEQLADKIRQSPMTEGRTMQRFFFANAEEVTLDAQGRIIVPMDLRRLAGLVKDVVLVGASGRVELWDADRWDDFESTMGDEDVLQAMDKTGV